MSVLDVGEIVGVAIVVAEEQQPRSVAMPDREVVERRVVRATDQP